MMGTNVVEYNPIPDMYDAAKEWGFGDATATELANLFNYILGGNLPPETIKRWQELDVIDEEGNVMLETEEFNPLEWVLFGLTWEGLVERKIVPEEEADV